MNWRRTMQSTAKALMVPIVILPLAAIFMAAGEFGPDFLDAAGAAIIIDNLPLLFAVGVAIGFTKYDGMAAFAAVVGHVVLTAVMRSINPGIELPNGEFIPNEMSVLGGILVGGYTAFLYYRFRNIKFPEFLGLFAGKRFVPIITALVSVVLGVVFGYLWPPINEAIVNLGEWIFDTGGYGVFTYGVLNRLLIPTGLHHILQNLLLHVFGSFSVNGGVVTGEFARFMAGDPTAGYFSGGFFVTMMFALPAAALAIVHESRAENRKQVAGVMMTAALTSIVIGITEPAEFTFMFTAPLLFIAHGLLTGSALLFSYLLGIRHYGYALPMFFINYTKASNPWLLFPLGAVYALIYYFLFRFIIRKFNYMTPGREVASADTSTLEKGGGDYRDQADQVAQALGGLANLQSVEACMTRLRISILNPAGIDEDKLGALPASGISRLDQYNLQIVLGTGSEQVREQLQQQIDAAGLITLKAPLDGEIIPLGEFPDPVFAQGMLGEGVGFMPSGNLLVAPAAGEIVKVFPGGHALVMRTEDGLELLLHIGLDTVDLEGTGFETICVDAQNVVAGDALIRFDRKLIAEAGKQLHSALIVTNKEQIGEIQGVSSGKAVRGRTVVSVIRPV
ncbi:MAG: hypothetical protein FH749_15455 [Firmicutes bacterium]|nr:hypothetical protein [Bacillota bacterium]